jgi:hypothetical protein
MFRTVFRNLLEMLVLVLEQVVVVELQLRQ